MDGTQFDEALAQAKASTRQETAIESLVREMSDTFGVWVVRFMFAATGFTLLLLVYRVVSILREFYDPEKYQEREAARRARAEKKEE